MTASERELLAIYTRREEVERELWAFYQRLLASQIELPPLEAKVLNENRWDLYD